MRTNHIKLQIEKLRVLEFLMKDIETDNDETTAEMLRKLKSEIENVLLKDF
jgi:hypothetical protein